MTIVASKPLDPKYVIDKLISQAKGELSRVNHQVS